MVRNLSQKQVKRFWRRLFEVYDVGDRVSFPDYNRRGTVVEKNWVRDHWEYEVVFDHSMPSPIERFLGEKGRVIGFGKMRYEFMKDIG